MTEIEPERVGEKLKKRIEDIEKSVKALLKAMKEIESVTGEAVMPQGEFLGVKFED